VFIVTEKVQKINKKCLRCNKARKDQSSANFRWRSERYCLRIILKNSSEFFMFVYENISSFGMSYVKKSIYFINVMDTSDIFR